MSQSQYTGPLNLEGSPFFNSSGEECPSDRPVAIPLGYQQPPTLAETVRKLVQSHFMSHAAQFMDAETFEEADDFDVGDDYDPRSPYEEDFEPPLPFASSAVPADVKPPAPDSSEEPPAPK